MALNETSAVIDAGYRLEDGLERERGRVHLTGTQALIRTLLAQARADKAAGLNTAGFVSGYRGSPLGGFDQAMGKNRALLERHGIRFQPGLNEALAATAVYGSQQVEAEGSAKVDGVFGLWYGKGPGVDWAGDAIKHAHAYGTSPKGGVLALAGDDHGAVSSTMAHQSDEAFKAWFVPVLHPASIAEYVELGLYGWALSRFNGGWVGFKAISEVVEGAMSFELPRLLPRFERPDPKALGIQLPPGGVHFRWQDPPSQAIEQRLTVKAELAQAFARANRIDVAHADAPDARIGILTVGKAHRDLMEALRVLGFADRAAIERLGLRILQVRQVWPADAERLRGFARGLAEVLVVEEKRPLVEDQLKLTIHDLPGDRRPRVTGKTGLDGSPLLPSWGELRPHRLLRPLASLLERHLDGLKLAVPILAPERAPEATLPVRTPHFCAGCPHSTSTKLPEGSKSFGGIGCHIMATWMDRGTIGNVQMGGEGSNWVGLAPFVETRHVFQNLGDGTYFHSGSLGIRQAVAAGRPITFKVLYNDAVAMTGGQAHDGPLDVPRITMQARAEGVERIALVAEEPEKYDGREHLLAPGTTLHPRSNLLAVEEELRAYPGVSVLVFDQTCAAEKRRRRKRGTYPQADEVVVINEAVCEGCGDCSKKSNCVAVQPVTTEFGVKRRIDQSSCNKDLSCLEGFCPSFVTLKGAVPKKRRGLDLDELRARLTDHPAPSPARIEGTHETVVTGIGGTGVLTVGALLGMAAHLEGRAVSVLDFTGLAQKNGAVLSFVRVAEAPHLLHQSRVEPGSADVVLACDPVVAVGKEAAATIREGGTRVVANRHAAATAQAFKDRDAVPSWERLGRRLARLAGEDGLVSLDAQGLALATTGDAVNANVLLMGFAWQLGLLPVSLEALERAVELNGVAVDANLRALCAGRLAAVDRNFADALLNGRGEELSASLDGAIAKRVGFLAGYQDEALANAYRETVEAVRRRERAVMGRGEERLSEAVAKALFKLTAVKDEYEVARLHTDRGFHEKLAAEFEPGFKLNFHMAPPGLSKHDSRTGHAKKQKFGPWLLPALRVLAKGKALRGTALDPFRLNPERREERRLLAEYKALLGELVRGLNPENHELACRIAAAPSEVRGYGHVKEAAIRAYEAEMEKLLAAFRRTNQAEGESAEEGQGELLRAAG